MLKISPFDRLNFRRTFFLPSALSALALSISLSHCVMTSTYNAKVEEMNKLRHQDQQSFLEQQTALNKKLKGLEAERGQYKKSTEELTLMTADLRSRLEKLGQNVEQLNNERAELTSGLQQAQSNLEELRKQKAAAEARINTFRALISQLRSMIDNGKLKVTVRNGRMQITLPNDILFDSGKTTLKTEGQTALAQVAQVLASIPERKFIVAGHTDNMPIKSSKFPSNWELSTARAVEVTKLLIKNGMKPEVLTAAGYGEFDPVAPNDTVDNRMLNRRIEIVLQPNISDLPSLDNLDK